MSAIHSNKYPASYYFSTLNRTKDYQRLEHRIEADVRVVGGGFTGVASALELAEKGYKVVLLEAHKIGWGASGRNGGQIIRGLGHDVEKFENTIGKQGVESLYKMGHELNQIIFERVAKYDIDCDLTMGYCDLATRKKDLVGLQQEFEFLNKKNYAYPIRLLDQDTLKRDVIGSDFYLGGLEDMGSGHLHPLNLCTGEAEIAAELGVEIFENSSVIKIIKGKKTTLQTMNGQVTANKVVLAGNAYLGNLEPKIAGKVLPAGSYVMATEVLEPSVYEKLLPGNHAVCDQRIDLDYFRLSADKRLLFGGMCNYSGRDPKDIKASLYPKMLKAFPQLGGIKIDFQWGGMIGIGANRLPQIGRLKNNIYYAQAYSGHGVNVTHLAAKLVAEAIDGQESGFDIFNKVNHITFPGGQHLRSPLLALGMMYHKMLDLF